MADRILRSNILTSDAVNSLSWAGEVFYRRLMSIVDDYGRYDGRVGILRGALYSLKLDKVSEADIAKWLDECQKAGLVSFYHVDGKPYLEILKFGQRLRIMKSKYPAAVICQQMLADVSELPPVVEVETNPKRNDVEGTTTDDRFEKVYSMFRRVTNWKADVITRETGKLLNKYPLVPITEIGPLVNSWAGNYREVSTEKKLVV